MSIIYMEKTIVLLMELKPEETKVLIEKGQIKYVKEKESEISIPYLISKIEEIEEDIIKQ
jgi:hypothetical protein